MNELENRYRRMLLLFPLDHRATYGDEMLGVLMAGAEPGQRRPAMRESIDLVRSALWMRLGSARTGVVDGRWRDVAGVFAVVASLLLAAEHIRPLLADYVLAARTLSGFDVTGILQALFWSVTALSVLIGWRIVALAAGWLAVAAEAAWLVSELPYWQGDVVADWWQWSLAVTCAIALSFRPDPGVLGSRRIAWVAVASSVVAVSMLADSLIRLRGTPERVGWGPFPWIDVVGGLLLLGYVMVVLGALAGVDAWVRRRVLVLFAPAVTMLGLDALGLRYFVDVVVLLTLPFAVLALGLLVIHRRERRMHLIQLGREAELAAARPPDVVAPA